MVSYFLDALPDNDPARQELSLRLPGQSDPWVIWTDDKSDPVAYVNVYATDGVLNGPYFVMVDISGRHSADDMVITFLKELQIGLGGMVKDDHGNTF